MGYFKMKYHMFLMRLYDRVCSLLTKAGIEWYSKIEIDQKNTQEIDQLNQLIDSLRSDIDSLKKTNDYLDSEIELYRQHFYD